MTTGTFTVGRDAQAVFIAPNGNRVDLSGMTDFSWTPEYKQSRSDPLNNPPIERFLPSGHRLKFTIDRNGGANDALFSQIEQGWWTIGSADTGTSDNGAVYVYIQETSGAQSILQFSGVALKLSNGGDFKTDAPVKQTIEGFAQRYTKAA